MTPDRIVYIGGNRFEAVYDEAPEAANYEVRASYTDQAGRSGLDTDVLTVHATPPPVSAPDAPEDLTVTAHDARSITVAWTDVASTEFWYEIEVDTSPSFDSEPVIFTQIPENTESHRIHPLQPETQYWIRVRSANKAGRSAWTDAVTETTDADENGGGGVEEPTVELLVATDNATIRYGTHADTPQGAAEVQCKWDQLDSNTRECLFRFDLSSIDDLTEVSEAELRLHILQTYQPDQPIAVYSTTGSDWDEDTVTWNSAPALDTLLHTQTVNTDDTVVVDVTSLIQSYEGTHITFRVKRSTQGSVGTDATHFSQRTDEDEDNRPTLALTIGGASQQRPTTTVSLGNVGHGGHVINQNRYAQPQDTITLNGVRWQAFGIWNGSGKVAIRVRNDQGTGEWTSYTLYTYDGTGGLPDLGTVIFDAHNTVNLAFDKYGYLHFVFNLHNDDLLYRRSTAPVDEWDGSVTNNLSMLGTHETDVTYPNFIRDPSGELYFMFRDSANVNARKQMFYAYDADTQTWSAAPGTASGGILIDGDIDDAWPYVDYSPEFDADGRLHISWIWRLGLGFVNNTNYHYVYWDGSTVRRIDGSVQEVPITRANCPVIKAIPTGSGLANQCALTVNPVTKRPHIAYNRFPDVGPQYQQTHHLFWDGTQWVDQQVNSDYGGTPSIENYALANGRPTIAIDDNGHIHIMTRIIDHPTYPQKVVIYSSSDMGQTWTCRKVTDLDATYLEPTYDRQIWKEDRLLQIPIMPWPGFGGPYAVSIVTYDPLLYDEEPIGGGEGEKPGVPTGFALIAAVADDIGVRWDGTDVGQDYYQVMFATDSEFSEPFIVTGIGSEWTSAAIINLEYDTDYWLRLRAVNEYGASDWTAAVQAKTDPAPQAPPEPTVPANPALLQIPFKTHHSLTCTWIDNAINEESYELEYDVSAQFANPTVLSGLAPNTTAYTIENLEPNRTYYVRVRALNSVGYSGYTNVASATTDPAPVSQGTAVLLEPDDGAAYESSGIVTVRASVTPPDGRFVTTVSALIRLPGGDWQFWQTLEYDAETGTYVGTDALPV